MAQKEELTNEEIQSEVEEFAKKLDILRTRYEQYFLGIERVAPSVLRMDVVRIMRKLEQLQIRNTATKFRLRGLIQKFHSYSTYWNRTLREIEDGTYKRHKDRVKQKELRAQQESVQPRKQTEQEESPEQDALRAKAQEELSAAAEDLLASLQGPSAAPAAASQPKAAAPAAVKRSSSPFSFDLDELDDDFDAAFDRRMQSGLQRAPVNLFGAEATPVDAVPSFAHRDSSRGVQRPVSSGVARYQPPSDAPEPLLHRPSTGQHRYAPPPAAPARPGAGSRPSVPGTPALVPPHAQRPGQGAAPSSRLPVAPGQMPSPPQAPQSTPGAAQRPSMPQMPAVPSRQGPPQRPSIPHAAAVAPPRPAEPQRPHSGMTPVAEPRSKAKRVYDEFVAARERMGVTQAPPSYDAFARSLESQAAKVKASHNCRDVDFKVVVKDGKPVLKPVPKS
ncbi:MAG: MXAN_5187 C-terminal domain-containing protein [Myxococcota bacterium]|jgi:hypothetical protein|nr:MXAN_5187 C-terminal domain-containing protein [Myxococcota bacterium]